MPELRTRLFICILAFTVGMLAWSAMRLDRVHEQNLQHAPEQRMLAARHNHWLPDLNLTPGQVSPDWTLKETMAPGGTQHHRTVTAALRKQVWAAYGYDKKIGSYEENNDDFEIDHLVPNCLGGSSEPENLWPQPYVGPWNAHIKDKLEMHIRAEVISGRMTLKQGQSAFTPDWTQHYRTLKVADEN